MLRCQKKAFLSQDSSDGFYSLVTRPSTKPFFSAVHRNVLDKSFNLWEKLYLATSDLPNSTPCLGFFCDHDPFLFFSAYQNMYSYFPTVDFCDLTKKHQQCPVCACEYYPLSGTVEKPVKLPCKHVVGSDCLNKLLAMGNGCPRCGKTCTEKDMKVKSPGTRRTHEEAAEPLLEGRV